VAVNTPAPTPLPKIQITTAADPTTGLTGAARDAAAALIDLFTQYGLGSLAPKIIEFLRQGYSADTVAIELQNTAEYKSRFIANDARIKKGLPALGPAEYISTERAYRQLMAASGLPIGFYDTHSDFRSFLENDVSPTEVKSRIDLATEAVRRAPAQTKDYFSRWYSSGDMIAYALDPIRAAPLIEQRIKAAEAAGIAGSQGLALTQATAERIGATGSTFDQLQQGLGFVVQEAGVTSKLSDIYGGDNVTTEDLVSEVFQNDQKAAERRRRLASQERAAFGGSSGVNAATLTKDAGAF
jgi:hypothetical protein